MIYFHTIVNEKVGIGNLSRCIIICNEIKQRGIEVKLFVQGSSKYKSSFQFQEIYFFESNQALIEQLIIESDDINHPNGIVLVADLPILDQSLIEGYRNVNTKTLISINDQYVTELNPDIYINSDEVMNVELINGRKYVGPEFQLTRVDLVKYRPKKFQGINKVKNISFIFGGSDPGYLIEETLRQIQKKERSFSSWIVIGPGIKDARKLNLFNLINKKVEFLLSPCIPDLISKSDLIVTMGGMTSYEAMYLGKPVLSVEWEYMAKYVGYLDEKGLLITLGKKDLYIERLCDLIEDFDTLERIARKGYFTIDGKGNERVANIIITALEKELN